MSLIKESIVEELKVLIPISTKYSEQLETAKTKTKKDIARKKLKQNNEKVADLLIALDRIIKNEEQSKHDRELIEKLYADGAFHYSEGENEVSNGEG